MTDSTEQMMASVELDQHGIEVQRGERFEFGKNWSKFLELLNDERIAEAESSLKQMLGCESLQGKRFLDIGSGSGLFSLAARRLGAEVVSFDYDPYSVACTLELRRRYFPNDAAWRVERGSVLDQDYVKSLGVFDIVYSWGVLHHTGEMWQALENASMAVADGGQLFIALYNDTGSQTTRWKWLKKTYNSLPAILRPPFALLTVAPEELKSMARAVVTLKPSCYIRSWTTYDQNRGMNKWRDIIDWVGGYPYEAARVDVVFDFFHGRGYTLTKLKCLGGLGCNEFIFTKTAASHP